MFFFKLLKVKTQIYCVEEVKRNLYLTEKKLILRYAEENQAYNHQE